MNVHPMRTRIKFCGMTKPGDVRLAAELGADAVGVVFAERSPRRVSPECAAGLRQALPPLVSFVALFMDNSDADIHAVIAHTRPDVLQFHGSEDDAFCRKFGIPYLKAIGLGGEAEPPSAAALLAQFPHASGFLFDGHAPGAPGGRGVRVASERIPTGLRTPWLLAGGLQPDNVAAAVQALHPWGVDVASGIECAPGVKDGARMQRFVEQVHHADQLTVCDNDRFAERAGDH